MKKLLFSILLFFLSFLSFSQISLNEVNISAIRYEKNYPITQTIIKTDSIEFLKTQKDPFFIIDKLSPSIYSQSDNGDGNGYSYTRLRGIDQTRINFNLNGIPLNEMEDQGIYFSNMPGFYNYISDISVQRGIGTSKYGNTSIGGSVNMESKNMFIKNTEFNSSLISNDIYENNFDFLYSSGNKNGFAYQGGISYLNNSGFKEHSGNIGGSIFYGIGYNNKNNIIKVVGFNGISKNQLSFYGVPIRLINENYKVNLNSIDDNDLFKQNFSSINWIMCKKNITNISFYFNNVNGTYNTSGVLFGVNSYQSGLLYNTLIEKDRNIFNIGININLYKRNHFGSDFSGYYYDTTKVFSKYTNIGYKSDISSYIKLIRKYDKVNLFIDLQIRNVFLTAKSDFSLPKYNWTFINPKIGINLKQKNNNLYLSIGYTRREPTRTDIIQNMLQENNICGANPDNINVISTVSGSLKTENVTNLEIGDKISNKKIDINLNLYFITIKNEFVSIGIVDPYSGFMWKKSVDRTFRYGIESDGKTKFKNLNLFYNIQYQFSNINKKYKIPFNPNIISNIGIDFNKNKFGLGLYLQYIGKMAMNYDENSVQKMSSPYYVLSGYAKYKVSNNICLSFNINNILNKKYYIPAGVLNESLFYVGELLNYKLSLNVKI